MRARTIVTIFTVSILPSLAMAQAAPVADAFREFAATEAKNLVAAAETMPADKYGYKPTPAQLSFGRIVVHLSGSNDALCGAIGDMKAPARTPVAETAAKEVLVARLRESFEFCHQALAGLNDSNLGQDVTIFRNKVSRANAIIETAGDWADHYSQMSNYLRINGELPPTAKKPGA